MCYTTCQAHLVFNCCQIVSLRMCVFFPEVRYPVSDRCQKEHLSGGCTWRCRALLSVCSSLVSLPHENFKYLLKHQMLLRRFVLFTPFFPHRNRKKSYSSVSWPTLLYFFSTCFHLFSSQNIPSLVSRCCFQNPMEAALLCSTVRPFNVALSLASSVSPQSQSVLP